MVRFKTEPENRRLPRLLVLISRSLPAFSTPLLAAEKTLTLMHTNDLPSRFLGFSPQLDDTPLVTGDAKTAGGWARVVFLIQQEKMRRENPVQMLDASGFLMGFLFDMLRLKEPFELKRTQKVEITRPGPLSPSSWRSL